MERGILRGAGGDENLKSNFIWPKGQQIPFCTDFGIFKWLYFDTWIQKFLYQ